MTWDQEKAGFDCFAEQGLLLSVYQSWILGWREIGRGLVFYFTAITTINEKILDILFLK